MINSFLSIVPPLLTILLVFVSRNVIASLLAGVTSSALIACDFAPVTALKTAIFRVFEVLQLSNLTSWHKILQSDKLLLIFFLLMLGILIALIINSGEGLGYAERLCRLLKTGSQAQLASIFLSCTLFIDDYLNVLTTAAVMKTLTDKFKIPRLKMAFLTTAMAAPLCSLIPISSWAAVIVMLLSEAGINTNVKTSLIFSDSFFCFIKAIPFTFFSIFLIIGAIFIVISNSSYGIMYQHEQIAATIGNLFGGHNKPSGKPTPVNLCNQNRSHSNFAFFSPLLVLSGSIFSVMLLTGGFLTKHYDFLLGLRNSSADQALFIGAAIGLIYTINLFWWSNKINSYGIFSSIKEGLSLMKDSLLVLVLAWTLTSFMKLDLGSGNFLAKLLMPLLSQKLLPLSVFLISGTITFSIGSAWATMAVITPIIIPMLPTFTKLATPINPTAILLVFPTIGAIISGAIFGSSLSPIADLIVLTAKNTHANHFAYIKAQMQYLLPVGLGSCVSFTLAGLLSNLLGYWQLLLISAIPGLLLTLGLIALLSKLQNNYIPTNFNDKTTRV